MSSRSSPRAITKRVSTAVFRQEAYVCPSCAIRQTFPTTATSSRLAIQQRKISTRSFRPYKPHNSLSSQHVTAVNRFYALLHQRRNASTVASTTAINAPLEIPPRFAELHAALESLRHDASGYINLSRTELAKRGLESTDGVIRIALLSTGSFSRAKELARLLCADPLAEVEGWEVQIQQAEDGRGLLLRYGGSDGPSPGNRLLRTISAPARLLKKNNIEILISPLNISLDDSVPSSVLEDATEAVLVPTLETPTSASGRISHISYPVHKAILLGEGPGSLIGFGRFLAASRSQNLPVDMVKLVTTSAAPPGDAEQKASDAVIVVDTELAGSSLTSFRESLANAVAYEKGWFKSGLPALTDWITQGTITDTNDRQPKPTIVSLVESIVNDAGHKIDIEASRASHEQTAAATPPLTLQNLENSITAWAEQAHTELQTKLDLAFAGKYWRTLSWWKLFWRVDDVTMVAEQVIERRWLIEAEKQLIFIAGRLNQAELWSPDASYRTGSPRPVVEQMGGWVLQELPPATVRDFVEPTEQMKVDDGTVLPPRKKPWPMAIPSTRYALTSQSIPALQALAQKLVLQAYSTGALTAAISTFAYVGISTTSIYEAGAVAALGLTWALRKLQTDWEKAREKWTHEVREDGRIVLKETEESIRRLVHDGPEVTVDAVAEAERAKARAAIERVKAAIEALQK